MSQFTKEEKIRRRARESFILFEHKEGSRLVDIKDVPAAVRACGVNPTTVQMNMIIDQLAALNAENEMSSLIGLENFEMVVSNILLQHEAALFRDDYHSLLRAFRAFDPEGKGYIEVDQIKLIITTKGEPMTDDEVNKMVNFAADDQGRIYYEDYAQKLTTDGRGR
mmetsp:Transcript_28915/g.53124  ORF Transcript_28915/g.53124 Transcript_28915/m.53124 type:complete len:166 (-) Transcript_28915:183-680(-)